MAFVEMERKDIVVRLRDSIVFKCIASVVVLLALYSIIIGLVGYYGLTESLTDKYEEEAFRICRLSAMYVDADRLEDYRNSGGKTEEYQDVLDSLQGICNRSGSTFVYVIQPDTSDYGHITFLFSTMNEKSHYTRYEFGYVRETTNDDYRQKYKALYERELDEALVIRDQGYIETDPHITAMIPLVGSDHQIKGILCVQRQMDTLIQQRNGFLFKVLCLLLAVAIILILIQSKYMKKFLLVPVKKITEEAVRFAGENTTNQWKLTDTIKNKDEIGKLASAIDQMEERTCDYMDDLTRITAEREKLRTEMTLASKIQAHVLPNKYPAFPDRTEFDIYATMDPAKEVGGDFYDFFLIDDDHLCMIIADVSDKGVPAALFMMASKIILENYSKMNLSPSEILEHANNDLSSNNQEDMFLTIWLGILEISSGIITAANAGHEYPVIKHPNGDFEYLKDKHGFVLGAIEDMTFEDYQIVLEPGSRVFVYTDGVPEAINNEAKAFGPEMTLEALNRYKDEPLEDLLRKMRETVDEFSEDAEQFDDITMLCLELKKD